MNRYSAYIGIDLAANPQRCSGFVAIESKGLTVAEALCLGDDREIVEKIHFYQKPVVAIDAPFGFGDGFIRKVDRRMLSLGYRVFPPGFSHMRDLTLRATDLVKKLKELNIIVIETHPKSVLKSSSCRSVELLAEKLAIKNIEQVSKGVKHIVDALLAAIASLCYDLGCSDVVEDIDGAIWLVKKLC
jgi:hypothetical protein